jgi:hypothetical protein
MAEAVLVAAAALTLLLGALGSSRAQTASGAEYPLQMLMRAI